MSLEVNTEFEPTLDRTILLARNLNSKTDEETFKNFIEVRKKSDVFNVVAGKNGKAIVILKGNSDYLGRSNSKRKWGDVGWGWHKEIMLIKSS